jgi:Cu/Ag efflux pump CusA
MSRTVVRVGVLLAALGCAHRGGDRAAPPPAMRDAGAAPPSGAAVDVLVAAERLDTASDVEREVTVPIEIALAGLPGVRGVRSRSVAGAARVHVELGADVSVWPARAAVVERLARLSLPDGITPVLPSPSGPEEDDVRFVVASDALPLGSLGRVVDEAIRPRLLTVPGVVDVEVCGGRRDEVHVVVDPARLAATGVPLAALAAAISAGGYLAIDDLRQVVVAQRHETPVRLADLAAIESGFAPPTCLVLLDGAAVVGVRVRLRSGEAAAAAPVRAALDRLAPALPPGVTVTALAEAPGAVTQRLDVRLPAGASLEERLRLARALDARLRARPGVARVLIEIHARDGAEADALLVRASVRAGPPGPAASGEIAAGLRADATALPGVTLAGGGTDVVTLVVAGPELEVLARMAARASAVMAGVPGVAALATDGADVTPRLELRIDRQALARLGIEPAALAATLAAARGGMAVGELADGRSRTPIRLTLGQRGGNDDPARLGALPVTAAAGTVPLAQVVSMTTALTPTAILRRDGQRATVVTVTIAGRPRAEVWRALKERLASELALPVGYSVTWPDAP